MSDSNNNTFSGGLSFDSALFLIFLVLKLTNNIDWSWWWVFSPLWVPVVALLTFLGLWGVFAFVMGVCRTFAKKRAFDKKMKWDL